MYYFFVQQLTMRPLVYSVNLTNCVYFVVVCVVLLAFNTHHCLCGYTSNRPDKYVYVCVILLAGGGGGGRSEQRGPHGALVGMRTGSRTRSQVRAFSDSIM